MKQLIWSLCLLMPMTAIVGQTTNTEKTFVKSYKVEQATELLLALNGSVEIQQWNEPHLRVQMQITLEGVSDAAFKGLIRSGRYTPKQHWEAATAVLTNEALQKEITINGQTVKEDIKYLIQIPKSLLVNFGEMTNVVSY